MRFGRTLHRQQIPEWTDFYFNYNSAKRLFKSACMICGEQKKDMDLTELSAALRQGLHYVEAFYCERLLSIQEKISLACDYWGISLESSASVGLDNVDVQEIEHLLATFLELLNSLYRLGTFGNVNRASFHRICRKIKKAQASSNSLHFNESELFNSQFADQKQCLKFLKQCKSFVQRLEGFTGNHKSISSKFSLFLVNFSARPHISFIHPHAAYIAIKTGDISALDRILEAQDSKDDGSSPRFVSLILALLECSVMQGSKKCVEMLLSRVLFQDRSIVEIGNSLRHLTASVGRVRRSQDYHALAFLVKELRSRHWPALVVKDIFQRLPLHYAAFYGLPELCQEYLNCMIEKNNFLASAVIDAILAKDIDGYTPLSLGVIRGHTDVVEIFLKTCEESIEASEIPNLRSIWGGLLNIALRLGFDRIVHILIAHHADISSPNLCRETVLYIAAQRGCDDVVRAVLDLPSPQRADVDLAETVRGWTPLFIACIEGHLSIAKHLLKAGANPTLCDVFGWTPKEHAVFRGHMKVADLLSSFNSDLFQHPPWSNARTAVPSIQLTNSRERWQETAAELKPSGICRSRYLTKDLDSQILVTLGPSNTRSILKAVDLEDSQNPHPILATHQEAGTTGYFLEISAIGATGTTKLVHLPILDDMINEPWLFTAKDPDKVKLQFRLYEVESYGSETKVIVGSGIAILASLKQGLGPKRESLIRDYTIPILDKCTSDFIGSVTFSFLVVTPLSHSSILSTSITTHGLRKAEGFTQIVGHRGSGANSTARTNLQIGENTIQSFLTAATLGASCVEFDVQLTKDYVPIIFHDFLVMETGGDTPLHTLSFDQFMHLSKSQAPRGYLSGMAEARYLEKTQNRGGPQKKLRSHSLNSYDDYRSQDLFERMKYTEEGLQNNIKGNLRGHSIQEPSTTLEQLLTILPNTIAFNLEIKYPMLWEAEDRNMETYSIELNFFVDTILQTIYRLSNNRNITLSSFCPEICILLSIKQQHFPILFINKAGSVPTGDVRASNLQEAIQFAKSWHLAGIVMLSDTFVMCPRLVGYARGSGLICGSYGNLNDEPECAMIQAKAGLDAIMVNKVRLISETFSKAKV